jgi:hypothetical protein
VKGASAVPSGGESTLNQRRTGHARAVSVSPSHLPQSLYTNAVEQSCTAAGMPDPTPACLKTQAEQAGNLAFPRPELSASGARRVVRRHPAITA